MLSLLRKQTHSRNGIVFLLTAFLTGFCSTLSLSDSVASGSPTSPIVEHQSTKEAQERAARQLRKRSKEIKGLLKKGRHQEALLPAQQALALAEYTFGSKHLETASTLTTLGEVYHAIGNYKMAEAPLKRALSIREEVFGMLHAETVASLRRLTLLYQAMGTSLQTEKPEAGNSLVAEIVERTNQEVTNLKQEITRLSQEGRYELAIPAAKRLVEIIKNERGPDDLGTAQALYILGVISHKAGDDEGARLDAEQALAIFEKALGQEHPQTLQALIAVGIIQQFLKNFGQAETNLARALEISERVHGPFHPDTGQSLNNLAELYRDQGKDDRAEPLLLRALSISEQTLGPEHLQTAKGLHNLAALYVSRKRLKEAQPLYERALSIKEKVLGGEHPDTIATLQQLGLFYRDSLETDKAEQTLSQVFRAYEKVFGPDASNTIASLNDLVDFYEVQGAHEKKRSLLQGFVTTHANSIQAWHMEIDQHIAKGDYKSAFPIARRALELSRNLLGREDLGTAISLNYLGQLHLQTASYHEAIALLEEALDICKKQPDPENDGTGLTLNNLGMAYERVGRFDQARLALESAIIIREKVLGREHVAIAVSLNNLGEIYRAMGKYEQAKPLYERAIGIWEKFAFDNKVDITQVPQIASPLNNLSGLYGDMGNYDKGAPLLERALEIRKRTMGPVHPEVAYLLINSGISAHMMGDEKKAEKLLKDGLEISKTALGLEHPQTVYAMGHLGQVYHSIGDNNQALELLKQGLAITRAFFGEDHPEVANSSNRLAMFYDDIGALDLALPLYEQVLAIRKNSLGLNHPDTAGALNNLGFIHKKLGHLEEAKQRFQQALEIHEKAFDQDHSNIPAILDNLGELNRTMGFDEEAERLFLRALAILELRPDSMKLTTLHNLASLYFDRGDYGHGFEMQNRAFCAALSGQNLAHVIYTAGQLGYFHEQVTTSRGPAIFYFKIAVNAAQRLRAGSSDLESSLQRNITHTWKEYYLELAHLLIQDGRLLEAEQVLAMLKEKELFEFVRRDSTTIPYMIQLTFLPKEQELTDRLEDNARQLTNLTTEMAALKRSNDPEENKAKRSVQLRERLVIESQRFDQMLTAVMAQLSQQGEEHRKIDLESFSKTSNVLGAILTELSVTTKSHPAVIYYVPGKRTTSILVRTQERVFAKLVPIAESQLNGLVAALREAITKRDGSYRESAGRLYQLLIAPIEPELQKLRVDTTMLYLVETLRYLPFAALYDAADKKHLVEKYRVSLYTPVAQAKLTEKPVTTWTAAALGVSQALPGFESLPAVAHELRTVVRTMEDSLPRGILSGQRYLDRKFTRNQFMALFEKKRPYPVMHVATHFRLVPGSEEQSSILLGDGDTVSLKQIRIDQGIVLRGYDLVTLSACETAVGSQLSMNGAEFEGLGVIFQNKGARSVLATLWKVQDAGTAHFMEAFYRARGEHRKTTKTEALQKAQLAMLRGKIKSGDRRIDLTHPYYWAPFVLMGNWM